MTMKRHEIFTFRNGVNVLASATEETVDNVAWTLTTVSYDGAGAETARATRAMTPIEIRAYKIEQSKQRIVTDPNPTVTDYAVATGLREPD